MLASLNLFNLTTKLRSNIWVCLCQLEKYIFIVLKPLDLTVWNICSGKESKLVTDPDALLGAAHCLGSSYGVAQLKTH